MSKISCICKFCGKEFEEYPSRIKAGKGVYCSKACMGKDYSIRNRGDNHPNWKEKVKCTCNYCRKEFEIEPNRYKAGRGIYCSKECAYKGLGKLKRGKNHPNWSKVHRICKNCGKEFWVKRSQVERGGGKYCSKDCVNKDRIGKFSGEKNPNYKEKISRICKYCGKKFSVVPSRVKEGNAKFCSKQCFFNYSKENTQERKKCKFCGKEFFSYKKQKRIYCSTDCAKKSIKENNPRSQKIKCICQFCEKEFHVKPSAFKRGVGKYCSQECNSKDKIGKYRGENSWHYKEKVKCVCEYCGEEFETFPYRVLEGVKYCSKKCHAEYQKESGVFKGKNNPRWVEKINRTCEFCGKEFEVIPSKAKVDKGRFCSKECKYQYLTGENASNWKGGISFEPYCPKFNEEFKERVRTFFGNKCYLCGKSSKDNGKKLSVHHVNYDKMICCNDAVPLFVPLCSSCHAKTNHDRQKWEDFFEQKLENNFETKCYFSQEEFLFISNFKDQRV